MQTWAKREPKTLYVNDEFWAKMKKCVKHHWKFMQKSEHAMSGKEAFVGVFGG